MPQHCINVMRAKRLKLNTFVSNKHLYILTGNHSETRTTLIHNRWQQL